MSKKIDGLDVDHPATAKIHLQMMEALSSLIKDSDISLTAAYTHLLRITWAVIIGHVISHILTNHEDMKKSPPSMLAEVISLLNNYNSKIVEGMHGKAFKILERDLKKTRKGT